MALLQNGSVIAILAVYALAVLLPGPSFIVITRASLGVGRAAGIMAALGTTAGVAVYATTALLGISALVAALPWLVTAIQVLGGAYLVYLGLSALRAALSKGSGLAGTGGFPRSERSSLMRNFGKAFLVSLGNPKIAAFFFGLFAPLVGPSNSADTRLFVLCGVVLIDLAYHQALANGLAVLVASKPVKQAGRWLDALTGTLMTAFGLRLLVEGARTRIAA